MPVEETGNLLILIDYITQKNGIGTFKQYWNLLVEWGNYLVAHLPDPGDQLCTDDFEGFSPHNVNLAAKGIIGLGAWSDILRSQGYTDESAKIFSIAQGYV